MTGHDINCVFMSYCVSYNCFKITLLLTYFQHQITFLRVWNLACLSCWCWAYALLKISISFHFVYLNYFVIYSYVDSSNPCRYYLQNKFPCVFPPQCYYFLCQFVSIWKVKQIFEAMFCITYVFFFFFFKKSF